MEEKNILIDTVFYGFGNEFIENLEALIALEAIDYIVIQHGEIDHTGGLIELMKRIPETPIVCTEECMHTIKGHFHKDYHFHLVKTGDTLEVGNKKQLTFIEMKMLHWPDSMATYLSGDNVLFSNDCFGQHLASEALFVDDCDLKIALEEAQKYYANILTPFSKMLLAKMKQIEEYNFNIQTIAPSHGLIWDGYIDDIWQGYKTWAGNYKEDYIVILYDTMWEGTKILAESIRDGIKVESPDSLVEVLSIRHFAENDILHSIFKSKLFLIGSPTYNNSFMPSIGGLITQIKGHRFHNKKAAVFGCYGWSGEATIQLRTHLKEAGVDVFDQELTCMWHPDENKIYQAVQFGKLVAKKVKAD
jgi:flavorubredoxin